MIFIGIDTGVHTGFAVWDSDCRRLTEVRTYSITQAMEQVRMIADIRGRDSAPGSGTRAAKAASVAQ